MQLLLDTHALIWWLEGNRGLSGPARRAIEDEDNDVLVSAASAWEIATKFRLGKLPSAEALALDVAGALASQDFAELPITVADAVRAGALPGPHRDPFDRLLIAQAQARDLYLVSNETFFDAYGVRRLW
ncbi:MAG: type II toxin-antitoxin system VapC family toxin [Chloroflexi bacterium]|nr:type II toxin-antitoxin system VapC family toxin [Chloroflexota bacterium]MYD47671.1 type II toxin-antitoxin system VapC family toxin [Chloroflexota bacterium]